MAISIPPCPLQSPSVDMLAISPAVQEMIERSEPTGRVQPIHSSNDRDKPTTSSLLMFYHPYSDPSQS